MHDHDRVGAIGEHRVPPVRGCTQAQQNDLHAGPFEFQYQNTRTRRGIAEGVTHTVGANGPKVDVCRSE